MDGKIYMGNDDGKPSYIFQHGKEKKTVGELEMERQDPGDTHRCQRSSLRHDGKQTVRYRQQKLTQVAENANDVVLSLHPPILVSGRPLWRPWPGGIRIRHALAAIRTVRRTASADGAKTDDLRPGACSEARSTATWPTRSRKTYPPVEHPGRETKNIKWVAKLSTKAYGGPVVAGGKVFVATDNRYPQESQDHRR